MAIVITRLITNEIKRFCKGSQRVKHLVKAALRKVGEDPEAYDVLEWPGLPVAEGVCVRKVKIVHRKHNFRMLFVHRKEPGELERAIFFQVIPRQANGYDAVNFDLLERLIRDEG